MNVIILLFSLLSPYFDATPQVPIHTEQPVADLTIQRPLESSPYISSFDSLAGVSLYTTKEELLLNKGAPINIVTDPWQNCLEYQYADASVGVCEGFVLYVHVSSSQGNQYGLHLNGLEIDPKKNSLQDTLGDPYFLSEDGDVYMRGNNALKIYRNMETGEWEGIDLFDSISS